jgi:hypothetical protein
VPNGRVHTTSDAGDHQRIPQGHKQDEHVRHMILASGHRVRNLITPAGHVGSNTKEPSTNGKPVTRSKTIFTCVMLQFSPRVSRSNTPLQCVDVHDYVWGKWYNEKGVLRVTFDSEGLLERLIVTALLNIWFFRKDAW